jgi:hypothetical protein
MTGHDEDSASLEEMAHVLASDEHLGASESAQPSQRQNVLGVLGSSSETRQPAPRAPRARQWYTRLNTLVAAVLLIVLVVGLVTGLILVRRSGSATSIPPTTGGSLNVYISGGSGVYKLDASTGAMRLSYTGIHGIVAAAPVVVNGAISILVSRGWHLRHQCREWGVALA